eukprot:5062004-Prymnesium_polylepis.2
MARRDSIERDLARRQARQLCPARAGRRNRWYLLQWISHDLDLPLNLAQPGAAARPAADGVALLRPHRHLLDGDLPTGGGVIRHKHARKGTAPDLRPEPPPRGLVAAPPAAAAAATLLPPAALRPAPLCPLAPPVRSPVGPRSAHRRSPQRVRRLRRPSPPSHPQRLRLARLLVGIPQMGVRMTEGSARSIMCANVAPTSAPTL